MASKNSGGNFVEIHVVTEEINVYQVLDLPGGEETSHSTVKTALTDIIAKARHQVDKAYEVKSQEKPE